MRDFSYTYLDKLIQIAKENHPRPKSFEKRIESAQTTLAREKLNWLDIISFSFIYNPNYTFNVLNPSYFQGIQVGVSLNLATTLQKPLNVKRARQDVELARLDKEEYFLSLETQVMSAYVTYLQNVQAAQNQASAYNNNLDVFNAVNARYGRSEVTYDVWVQAQTSLSGAAQAKISSEGALLISKRNLEELLGGRKLEEIK